MYYTQAYMYVRYQGLSFDTFLRSPMGELFVFAERVGC